MQIYSNKVYIKVEGKLAGENSLLIISRQLTKTHPGIFNGEGHKLWECPCLCKNKRGHSPGTSSKFAPF